MSAPEKPYTMVVETLGGGVTRFLADRIAITDGGAIRLYIDGKLVGAFKSDKWERVMVVAKETGGPR